MEKQNKVLLVDDEASIRRQLSVGLMQSGFEVEDCEDGFSALKKIEAARRNSAPYRYVITDIHLPDINGLKLLQVIKSKYPDLPVVVISGYGDEHTQEEVKGYFGSAYLDKPFDVYDLEAVLKRIGQPESEAAGLRPKTAVEEGRPVSAYVFIRCKADADLYGIFNKLYFADGVLYCDAVRGEFSGGEWDTVLLVQAPNREGIEDLVKKQLLSVGGIEHAEIHHSDRPWLGDDMESFVRSYERMYATERTGEDIAEKRNLRRVSAYAILEIDRSHLIPLFSKLYFTENVVYCDATDGGNAIILFIQAQDFDQIRRTISNNIRPQAGVLRVKILNIVELITM